MLLLLIVALQAAGDDYVIDKVCVGSTGQYRINGAENSTYEWLLYDEAGNTVSITNKSGIPFKELDVASGKDIFGSEITINWNKPGTFKLAAIQYSFPLLCDTLQQGIVEVYDLPEVFAGNPIATCSGSVVLLSGATATNTSVLAWSSSGSGTFDDPAILNPVYTPSSADILAGIVTLTISGEGLGDPASCTEATSTVTITLSNLQLMVTATEPKCFGGADGTAKAELTGAYGSVIYSWTGPNGFTGNQAELTGLTAGTYSVTATDANGCTSSGSVTIGEPPLLVATASVTPAECFGANDGSATVSVSGGTASYTFLWSDLAAQNTQTATSLSAGNYIVTVTDVNGCSATASINISEPLQLTATATGTSVSCYGGTDGAATVSVSGGTVSYTYLWNDPAAQKTAAAGNLALGTYQVTVTDANGCTATASVNIDQPALLTASIDATEVKCFGGNDGSAMVNVSGGTASYTYLWNDPLAQTTQTATGLKTGTYNVKVTDANGCTTSASVTINEPTLLTASTTGTPAKCFNGSDGTATVSVSGGTASYTYLWSDPLGQTTSTASGLAAGSYTVTVTDLNLCQATASVTITQPTQIIIAETHIDSKCSGSKPGSIDITVSEGTPGYTYSWVGTNGFTSTNEDISGLAGTQSYTITVTDANGCTASSNIFINEEKNITLAETHQDINCFAGNNGSIDLDVKGGKKPYVYSWYNTNDLGTVIATTEDLTNLVAGTYRAVVVDGNGCDEDITVTLIEPEKLVATVSGNNIKCFGGNDGSATVSVSGGTVSYTYSWNDAANQTTQTASGLKVGQYTVTVTDAKGCSVSSSVTLIEPTLLQASVTSSNVNCYGGNNGSATVSVSGGTSSYTYLWDDLAAQTTATATNLFAGNYNVKVTDSNGCSISATITITQPGAPLVVLASATDVICYGNSNGTASSTVTGGTIPYSYLWNDASSQTTPIATGLKAGTYQLTVTDARGCTSSVTIDVSQPALLTASVSGFDVKCFGGNDGSASVTPAGGIAPLYLFVE